jgi:CDP-diacylglycerol pyrophosphatase
MRARRFGWLSLAASLGVATALLIASALGALPPIGTSRDALREIVQEQCMPHFRAQHDPSPCLSLEVAPDGAGYALLADRKGGAHLLLIATSTVSGIESDALRSPSTPDYFRAAWAARGQLAARAGRALPRETVGLAINPPRARSQDQLHIHIECLRDEVARALRSDAPLLSEHWTVRDIAGARYEVRRLGGAEPEGPTPFEILDVDPPEPGRTRRDFTLVLAGMQYADGPGFALLAGTQRAGELLLDASCAIAATGR